MIFVLSQLGPAVGAADQALWNLLSVRPTKRSRTDEATEQKIRRGSESRDNDAAMEHDGYAVENVWIMAPPFYLSGNI